MRITNSIMQRSALVAVQSGLQRLNDAQTQVSTGKRMQKASDDPTAASEIMTTSASLDAIDQYKRNIDSARTRATTEEGVLDQLSDALSRAKELGVGQGGADATAQTRQVAKGEVDQLLQFVVGLGNTKLGDDYLFGGKFADRPPITASAPYYDVANPPSGSRDVEISSGQFLDASHDGMQVFVDTKAIESLQDLSNALGNNDQAAIAAALTRLDGAFDGVQALVGDVGARVNRLQVMAANLDALKVNLQTFKSDLEDVDLEKAVTELVGRQTAYQAALLATSRVTGMNLTDYLR